MTTQELPRTRPISPLGHRGGNGLVRVLTSRTAALSVAALLLILYFQQASGGLFITSTNISLLLRQTAVVAVAAAGVAVLIIMGEIDLSIGSAAFLTGLVAAQCQVAGWGVLPSILAALVVGMVLGLIHGIVVTRFAVPAFVVTLAGLLLWRAIGLIWTNAAAIGPVSRGFSNLTEGRMPTLLTAALAAVVAVAGVWRAYARHAAARNGGPAPRSSLVASITAWVAFAAILFWVGISDTGLPNALLWISAVAGALGVGLTRAKVGRRAFLVGSNSEAAVYAGINAKKLVLFGFLVMGVIYGIAGTMLTARVGSSTADLGTNLELTAIAATVIGGNSLRGGMGSIQGAILGAFLLSTIDNGMALLGVSSYAEDVVKALILVFAVGIDGYFTRRQLAR